MYLYGVYRASLLLIGYVTTHFLTLPAAKSTKSIMVLNKNVFTLKKCGANQYRMNTILMISGIAKAAMAMG